VKPRKVLVTLELESPLALASLRSKDWWSSALSILRQKSVTIQQVQANVVRPIKAKTKRK